MENKENRIRARIMVDIDGYLDAPLLVASGEDEKADIDQLLTADGIPFIPGSSMAGVLRSYLEQAAGLREAEALFGTLGWTQRPGENLDKDGKTLEFQSRILIYDTCLENSDPARRDGVRLNEGKTSDENMKFDMQAVETGADCRIRLEIIVRENQVTDTLDAAIDRDLARVKYCISGLKRGSLRLGARKNRGFGKLEVRGVHYRTFRMENRDDFQAWLDWSWDQADAFDGSEEWGAEALLAERPEGEHCMQIPLTLSGTLLVRSYANPRWGKESGSEPDRDMSADCGQLTLKDGAAVIPGSTWPVRSAATLRIWRGRSEALEAGKTRKRRWNHSGEPGAQAGPAMRCAPPVSCSRKRRFPGATVCRCTEPQWTVSPEGPPGERCSVKRCGPEGTCGSPSAGRSRDWTNWKRRRCPVCFCGRLRGLAAVC